MKQLYGTPRPVPIVPRIVEAEAALTQLQDLTSHAHYAENWFGALADCLNRAIDEGTVTLALVQSLRRGLHEYSVTVQNERSLARQLFTARIAIDEMARRLGEPPPPASPPAQPDAVGFLSGLGMIGIGVREVVTGLPDAVRMARRSWRHWLPVVVLSSGAFVGAGMFLRDLVLWGLL